MDQYDLQNRYKVEECENGYTFYTHSGNQYYVLFLEYNLFDDAPYTCVYSVTIERVDENDHNTGEHHELRNTILYIFNCFFQNHQNALISVCDIKGGKHLYRKKLFASWINCYAPEELTCITSTIRMDGKETYAMLLYMRDNIDALAIENTFKQLADYNFYYSC